MSKARSPRGVDSITMGTSDAKPRASGGMRLWHGLRSLCKSAIALCGTGRTH